MKPPAQAGSNTASDAGGSARGSWSNECGACRGRSQEAGPGSATGGARLLPPTSGGVADLAVVSDRPAVVVVHEVDVVERELGVRDLRHPVHAEVVAAPDRARAARGAHREHHRIAE